MSNTFTYLITLVFLIFNASLWAQFEGPFVITTDAFIRVAHIADVDNDGNQDILTATAAGIQWYANNGVGVYAEATSIMDFVGVDYLNTGDLDGDGDEDIVFQSEPLWSTGDAIFVQWLRNEGDGVFIPADTLVVEEFWAEAGIGVMIVDVNQDGHLDIISRSFVSYLQFDTRVTLNNGDGTFAAPFSIDFRDTFNTGDLNGDGYPDYVSGSLEPWEGWLLFNDGTGDVSTRERLDRDIRPSNALVCDVDNDSWPDVIFDSSWYRNLEGNGFASSISIYNGNHSYGNPIRRTDLNQDGLQDFLSYDYLGGVLSWHQYSTRNGLESYIITNTHQRSIQLRGGYHNIVGDIDGDGLADIIAQLTDGSLVWYQNQIPLPSARIQCFWDQNADGIYDANEVGVNNFPLRLNEENTTYYTDSDGLLSLYLEEEGAYSLSAIAQDCWEVGTETNYTFTWDQTQTNLINIPLQLESTNEDELRVDVHSGITRCSQIVPVYMSVLNNDCAVHSGLLALVLDEQVELVDGGTTPTLREGNLLWWSFDDLNPSQAFQPRIYLQMPNAESTGDSLKLQWYLYQTNCSTEPIADAPESTLSEGFTACTEGAYTPIVRCAYDPNDKQVIPFRDSVRNLTLFEEELTYTIRFQNTGNDTAFQVWIRDELDVQLDWSTFKPLTASHSYTVDLDEDSGELTFFFDNILLPDSTTNNPGSQGYVQYAIQARPDLLEYSVIYNEARIFFDQNPPILTNSVSSEMVSEFPSLDALNAFFTFSLNDDTLLLRDETQGFANRWSWDFGDDNQSNDRNPTHIYTDDGEYEVCFTVSNTAGSDTYCEAIVVGDPSNTVAPAVLTSLNLFPNPTSGDIMVALTCAESTAIQLELYNLFGQRLWQSPVTESQQLNQSLDLTAYSTGTYLLRLRIGEEWVTRKVVKLK